MRVIVDTYPAGEKSFDGGEYGFWTVYSPIENEEVIREYETTADFAYCVGCGSFEDGICSGCRGMNYNGVVMPLWAAAYEIAALVDITGREATDLLESDREVFVAKTREYVEALARREEGGEE